MQNYRFRIQDSIQLAQIKVIMLNETIEIKTIRKKSKIIRLKEFSLLFVGEHRHISYVFNDPVSVICKRTIEYYSSFVRSYY